MGLFNFDSKKDETNKPKNMEFENKPADLQKKRQKTKPKQKRQALFFDKDKPIDVSKRKLSEEEKVERDFKIHNEMPLDTPENEPAKTEVQSSSDSKYGYKPYVEPKPYIASKTTSSYEYKPPLVLKKLTILLLENSVETDKEREKIIKMGEFIKNNVLNEKKEEKLCVINYGNSVQVSEISNISQATDIRGLVLTNIGDSICLYDALLKVEKLFSENHLKETKEMFKREAIKDVEIIGVGTCRDNCSKTSKEVAIETFSKVIKAHDVTTKYMCISEESFLRTAEIGFHLVSSMNTKFQQE